jgi:hypothetical protein
MKRFTDLVSKGLKKVGGKFSKVKTKVKEIAEKAKHLVRNSHLFAKTKEEKSKVGKKLYHTTKEIHKAGKSVEFGLKWGVSRIDGFALGFLIKDAVHASDKKFCLDAIHNHIEIFGKAPEVYGFDRGGYSPGNIKKLQNLA